jgi:hypothetical protein
MQERGKLGEYYVRGDEGSNSNKQKIATVK